MDSDETNYSDLAEQIERCRRLASMIVDDELRHSLEDLADEYEAQLPPRPVSFMLRPDYERE